MRVIAGTEAQNLLRFGKNYKTSKHDRPYLNRIAWRIFRSSHIDVFSHNRAFEGSGVAEVERVFEGVKEAPVIGDFFYMPAYYLRV